MSIKRTVRDSALLVGIADQHDEGQHLALFRALSLTLAVITTIC